MPTGRRLVLAGMSGQRESTESWAAVLRDLEAARPAGAEAHDRRSGISASGVGSRRSIPRARSNAARTTNSGTCSTPCPKKHQAEVKAALQHIANADTAHAATVLRDRFARTYHRPHPNAVERLAHDREQMIAYYAFPQQHCEHRRHLRTTNVIESPYAAVRRARPRPSASRSVENATALVWKTLLVVEHRFRKLNAPHLCTAVSDGVAFPDGVRAVTPTRKLRAA